MKEGKFERIKTQVEKVGEEPVSEKERVVPEAETWASPEEGAEELYALWRDYNRIKFGLYREALGAAEEKKVIEEKDKPSRRNAAEKARIQTAVESDSRLARLKEAIKIRFQDENVREVFEKELERNLQEEEKIAPSYENYLREKELKEKVGVRRLEIYRTVFIHREKEPDELTLLELADIAVRVRTAEDRMRQMENENSELAARISFERIRSYREQFKKEGFIWAPSREEYFNKILEHLVIVNQNRPLLLYGETGTGKTRLARAAAKRLGTHLYEVGEEAKTDIRPLLGLRAIDNEGSYIVYGQLGQAITGKKTSRDKKAGPGGIFYMDELNGYPPDALRSLIKQISGRRAGEEVTFAAWSGITEKVVPGFAFIGSANLPSEKHPDRPELPVEVARELGSLEVDYPPETPENSELYEMMLVALMDQNDRIRLPADELGPKWKEIVDAGAGVKRFELDADPKSGGTLWRFANLTAEIQRSYKGEKNALTPTERDASYLRYAVLDPGLVLAWLMEYRKSALYSKETLKNFLALKISEWASQKIYPEEDRNLLKKFQEAFDLTV